MRVLRIGEIAIDIDQRTVERGGKAVELVRNGNFGKMVANHPPDIVPIPLGEVVGRTKTVPLEYDLLLTARSMGICFGD